MLRHGNWESWVYCHVNTDVSNITSYLCFFGRFIALLTIDWDYPSSLNYLVLKYSFVVPAFYLH